ncbi:WD-40 repeat-containing protein [Reticulomyxa filosa]|uniref:WD-40 repeat-containing protein n=1 Tax=Reticulomyxa filosa TaxID=46433 RepID=X6N8A0_RETFI|nr:WD-40 repeat-containing protein [Reticulomyxa filosa]|eukprot:ETO21964.1 WD-40 repeat-containing protein [Reticulomyxa filosa]
MVTLTKKIATIELKGQINADTIISNNKMENFVKQLISMVNAKSSSVRMSGEINLISKSQLATPNNGSSANEREELRLTHQLKHHQTEHLMELYMFFIVSYNVTYLNASAKEPNNTKTKQKHKDVDSIGIPVQEYSATPIRCINYVIAKLVTARDYLQSVTHKNENNYDDSDGSDKSSKQKLKTSKPKPKPSDGQSGAAKSYVVSVSDLGLVDRTITVVTDRSNSSSVIRHNYGHGSAASLCDHNSCESDVDDESAKLLGQHKSPDKTNNPSLGMANIEADISPIVSTYGNNCDYVQKIQNAFPIKNEGICQINFFSFSPLSYFCLTSFFVSICLTCVHAKAFFQPKLLQGKSHILNAEMINNLCRWFPLGLQSSDWKLLFTTEIHGTSFLTLYERIKNQGSTLFIIQDTNHFVFGVFISEPWPSKGTDTFFGGSDTFVFRVSPNPICCNWQKSNRYFVLAQPDSITFGGGYVLFFYLTIENVINRHSPALRLAANFALGVSQESETFANPCLASQIDFHVVNMEVWGIDD